MIDTGYSIHGLEILNGKQIETLEKMYDTNVRSIMEGKLTEKGLTATKMTGKFKMNKNKLVSNLEILAEYGLADKEELDKPNQESWKYYALSEVGEILVIKEKIKRTYDEYKTKKLLQILQGHLQYVRNVWDKLIKDFGDLPYMALKKSSQAISYSIRNEKYLPFPSISIQTTLTSKSNLGFVHFERTFPIFKKINEYEAVEQNLSNIGLYDIPRFQLNETGSKKLNILLRAMIKETLNNFLTYGFYFYLISDIRLAKNNIKTWISMSKTKEQDAEVSRITSDMITQGNRLLSNLGSDNSYYSTMADIVLELNRYEDKILAILQKNPLKNKIKELENKIISHNPEPILS